MKIEYKSFDDFYYPEDMKRLFNAALSVGMIIPLEELETCWENFSDSVCASWLIMDRYSDEQLVKIIKGDYEPFYED